MANTARTVLPPLASCRSCGSQHLLDVLSLGDLFVSAFIDAAEQAQMEQYPLDLVLCDVARGGCGLLQLKHTVPSEVLYRNYWYRSGTNKTMTDELRSIVAEARTFAPLLGSHDTVIDIGCNDGTLLRSYGTGVTRVGFEPAKNLAPIAALGATKVINDFFNVEAWQREFANQKAKIITAIAMFYDLPDPNKFVGDVAKCLDTNGVFVIQMSYLPLMLSQNAFDNICHEHLEYYSLASLEKLLVRHGLEVFDVETNDTNGGSFRVFIKHRDGGTGIRIAPGAHDRLAAMRTEEGRMGLHEKKTYDAFGARVMQAKTALTDFIVREVAAGKKVYVYGASTKGNTLLQYFGLKAPQVTAAAERSQYKWGKNTVGSLIPIISEEQARADKPDYFLVLPWHFLNEFIDREDEFLANGGSFLIPLPEFKIVKKS